MIRHCGFRTIVGLAAATVATLIAAQSAAGAGGPLIPDGAGGKKGVIAPGPEAAAPFRYHAVVAGRRTVLERIATDGGTLESTKQLDGSWALPAVTINGDAGGLAADGNTLVLIRPAYDRPAGSTSLLIVDTSERRMKAEPLTLNGRFSFDAISPDGRLIYLVQYPNPRDALNYRVRAYDLREGGLVPGDIVDPEEPDEQMTGQPVARQASPDGRWAYTLYGGGEETFIHALDTKGATAVCVDLEQFGPRALYSLGLDVDPESGTITVLKNGAPAAVVDPKSFEVEPVADVEPGRADGGPAEDEGGFAWWLAAGAVAVAGGVVLLAFRLRRRRPTFDEQELERLVGDEPRSEREEREWDPVP